MRPAIMCLWCLSVVLAAARAQGGAAPEKLVGIHSARVMSQSFPWVAQEAGLFKKYNIDFNLVFISSSNIVTAALLGGDAEMTITGAIGNVAAYVRGSTDLAFTGGIKNVMTQTVIAGGNIKRVEDLRGKKIGMPRIGGNGHYFAIQALRRYNLEANRDYGFVQTGGEPETLAALIGGAIEVGGLVVDAHAKLLHALHGRRHHARRVAAGGARGGSARERIVAIIAVLVAGDVATIEREYVLVVRLPGHFTAWRHARLERDERVGVSAQVWQRHQGRPGDGRARRGGRGL